MHIIVTFIASQALFFEYKTKYPVKKNICQATPSVNALKVASKWYASDFQYPPSPSAPKTKAPPPQKKKKKSAVIHYTGDGLMIQNKDEAQTLI